MGEEYQNMSSQHKKAAHIMTAFDVLYEARRHSLQFSHEQKNRSPHKTPRAVPVYLRPDGA
jgi:hypothetical protein